VITPDQRRQLQASFERANQIVGQGKYDLDQVNKLYTQCIIADPGNLLYVDAFLQNLERKYPRQRSGARLRVFSGKGAFKKALSKRDWQQVFRLGPVVLQKSPWDAPTLCGMATACEAQEDPSFDAVELRYLQTALAANADDLAVRRQLAKSLSRMGRFDDSREHWQHVLERLPEDAEATQAMSYLSGSDRSPSERHAGDEEDGPTRPASSGDSETRLLEQQLKRIVRRPSARPQPSESTPSTPARQIKLTRRQVLENLLASDPTEVAHYLELAEILANDQRYGEAKRVLLRAQNVSPGEMQVRDRLEDLEIRQARHQLAVAEMQAAELETPAAYELVQRLREELQQREIEQYAARCQRYPDHPGLQYEFGLRLKRAGRYSEALIQFQGAYRDQRQRPGVLIAMGECCQHLKQFEKALRHYLDAARRSPLPDLRDCHLLAHYRAGVLAAALKQSELARQCLSTVVQADPHYKDAQSRLDKLPPIGDKG
jgi:tetratricopeptide (TPR) repeat protein